MDYNNHYYCPVLIEEPILSHNLIDTVIDNAVKWTRSNHSKWNKNLEPVQYGRKFQISEDERRKALIAGSNTSEESQVTTKKRCKQRRASASQKKAAGGQSKTDHLTEAMFANFQYLAPDFQIILLERILHTYTSKKQFEDEVDFFYPFSVSITIMLSFLCMAFL